MIGLNIDMINSYWDKSDLHNFNWLDLDLANRNF